MGGGREGGASCYKQANKEERELLNPETIKQNSVKAVCVGDGIGRNKS